MSSYQRYLQQKNNAAIKKYSDYEAYIARKNFDHFCCCLQGGTGPSGPSGAQGLFGGTSVKYSNPSTEGWNNATTPPTGPAQGIRGNNLNATLITKIYASRDDGDNTDVMDVLKILETVTNYEKGIIKITKIDDSSRFIMMRVITVTDQINYVEYEGSIVMATSSVPFATGEAVVLTITANGNSDLRNELTVENAEFFPLILRNDSTIIGATGATGYTETGVTINPGLSALTFSSLNTNPENFRTRLAPFVSGSNSGFNMFVDTDSGTGPSGGIFNIGKQNNIPISIDHYGSSKISTAIPTFSGATGPQAQFVVNNTDGVRLETKKAPGDAAFQPKIFVSANYGQISITATGQGATSTQGPINITSSSTISSSHPISALSVDRSSGIGLTSRGNTGIAPTSGNVIIAAQNMDGSLVKTMGLLQMQNNGNVTLQSGPGYTGVDKGILRLDSLGVSGGMMIENSGDAGLNITNRGASGMNLISNTGHLALSTANSGNEVRIGTAGFGSQIQLTTNDGSIQLLPSGAGSRINLHSSNNAAGGISLISTGLGSIFDLRSDDTIDIKADKRVNIGSNGGVTGVMHVMDGTTGTIKLDGGDKKFQLLNGKTGATGPQIILDGSNNNLFIKDGWNSIFDSIPSGFTGPSGPHPIIDIDGLYSALATGTPQIGQPYGYLPAGKIEFGGYTYSNHFGVNPETGSTGPLKMWEQTNRLVIDLTAGSEFNNTVIDPTTTPPTWLHGAANAGNLVTIKGSVSILPNGSNMPWNSSLYMGKWGFGGSSTIDVEIAQSSSNFTSAPGSQTLYPGSGNVYCNAVKQNIVHVSPSPFTDLTSLIHGYQGQSLRGMYYNGGDLAYCIVDSTNGQNGWCSIALPSINNNMLGMSLTVTRMFVDDGSVTGTGKNAVLIKPSGWQSIDKLNAPNSICVEDANSKLYVSIDPYNTIPTGTGNFIKPTTYNSVNIGSVTFVASQKGWYNDDVTGGTSGDDFSGDITGSMYVWVVISTGSPGK